MRGFVIFTVLLFNCTSLLQAQDDVAFRKHNPKEDANINPFLNNRINPDRNLSINPSVNLNINPL